MNKRSKIVFGLVLILSGCMGGARPDWVQNDTPSFLKEQAFYGVGKTSGVRNKVLAEMTAENIARSEVNHALDAYSRSLMKAYQDSLSPKDLKKIKAAHNLEFTFRTYALMAMFDATVEDSWTDTEKDEVYFLVKLKLRKFTEKLRETEEAGPTFRPFVKENAATLFDRFMAQYDAPHQKKS